MRPMRSCPNSAGAGGMAMCNQSSIGLTRLRTPLSMFDERTLAFAQGPERLVARHHRELLVVVVGIFRFLRALHLEQVHVANDAAVDADLAVVRHEIVDRHL